MSNAIIQAKAAEVQEVVEELQGASTVIVIDYLGLNVSDVTELRKQLREAGASMRVVKNTLLRRAAAEADMSDLDEFFVGPSAIVYSDDVVAPAKVLTEFVKDNDQVTIKGGMIEGVKADLAEIEALAKLPSREALLSMLLSALQGPMRNLAGVLNNLNPAQRMVYALKAIVDKGDAA